jgi:hypothetical protein
VISVLKSPQLVKLPQESNPCYVLMSH